MGKNFDEKQVDEPVKMNEVSLEEYSDNPEVEETKVKNTDDEKSIEQLVSEVIIGAHGTGRERMLSLGDKYEVVQHEVNQLIKKGEI